MFHVPRQSRRKCLVVEVARTAKLRKKGCFAETAEMVTCVEETRGFSSPRLVANSANGVRVT